METGRREHFDAFVCYTRADSSFVDEMMIYNLENVHGLRLFIPVRNMVAGNAVQAKSLYVHDSSHRHTRLNGCYPAEPGLADSSSVSSPGPFSNTTFGISGIQVSHRAGRTLLPLRRLHKAGM